MRPHQACLVAVAMTALTKSSAGGPNMARPQQDTLMGAGIVGAAATDWPQPHHFFKVWFKKSQQLSRPCVKA